MVVLGDVNQSGFVSFFVARVTSPRVIGILDTVGACEKVALDVQ